MHRLALLLLLAATPAAAQDGPCGAFEAVEPADDLAAIAARCEVTEEDLLTANPGLAPDRLPIGASLALAPPEAPEARYTALAGRYAPVGGCAAPALILAPEEFTLGDRDCTFAGAESLPGALVVTGSGCDGGGSTSVALIPLAGGGIEMQTGYDSEVLEACEGAPQPSNP